MFLGNLLLSPLFLIHRVVLFDTWPIYRVFHSFDLSNHFWGTYVLSLVRLTAWAHRHKPSRSYSHVWQVWLLTVVSKPISVPHSEQVWAADSQEGDKEISLHVEFTNLSVAIARSLQVFKKPSEQLPGKRICFTNNLQSHCFWWLSSKQVPPPQSCAGVLKKWITLLVFLGPLL